MERTGVGGQWSEVGVTDRIKIMGMNRMVVLLNNLRKSAESADKIEGFFGVRSYYERDIRDD